MSENVGASIKGNMKVSVKTDKGMLLSKDHGFTIEEENGNVLSFDYINHPEFGAALLFGNQVFFLKFWKDEDLQQGLETITKSFIAELERRKSFGINAAAK
jgi:hypothetical protein